MHYNTPPKYTPDLQELERLRDSINSNWSPAERRRRYQGPLSPTRWSVPVIATAELPFIFADADREIGFTSPGDLT